MSYRSVAGALCAIGALFSVTSCNTVNPHERYPNGSAPYISPFDSPDPSGRHIHFGDHPVYPVIGPDEACPHSDCAPPFVVGAKIIVR